MAPEQQRLQDTELSWRARMAAGPQGGGPWLPTVLSAVAVAVMWLETSRGWTPAGRGSVPHWVSGGPRRCAPWNLRM